MTSDANPRPVAKNSNKIHRRKFLKLGGLSLAGLASRACVLNSPAPVPPSGRARARFPIRFENRHVGSGVDFILNNGTIPDKPIIDSVLGGVAVFDYDEDGFLDIFLTNEARIPSLEKDDRRMPNCTCNYHRSSWDWVTSRKHNEPGPSSRSFMPRNSRRRTAGDRTLSLSLGGVTKVAPFRGREMAC